MEQEIFKNKREATLLGTQISFALMFVTSMMMLTGTIASCFFLFAKSCSIWGAFFHLLFYVHSITSIVIGGKAINEVRNSGFAGKWDIAIGKEEFNRQAILLLFAAICYGLFILTF